MTTRCTLGLRFTAFGLLLAATTAMAAVDPGLLNLVMPDAQVISGIQVAQTLASPFGQYILSQMAPGDPGFQQFLANTGFDPSKDLQQILAATGNTTVNPQNVLVLGRGTFQLTQINTAATSYGAIVTQYRGVNIYASPDSKSQSSVAFPDATTAIIGNISAVEAAIDRDLAKSTFTGPLATLAQTVGTANQAWFATTSPLSDFLSGKLGGTNLGSVSSTNLLQSVLQATGGIAFTTSGLALTADALTASPQNAQALIDVLKFVVSLIQSNVNDQKVTTLANAATFAVNGSTAHISLSIPEQQAEQLFMPPSGAKNRHSTIRQ
jgi:hypothetical protein